MNASELRKIKQRAPKNAFRFAKGTIPLEYSNVVLVGVVQTHQFKQIKKDL